MEGFECAGPWNLRPRATWFLWSVSVIHPTQQGESDILQPRGNYPHHHKPHLNTLIYRGSSKKRGGGERGMKREMKWVISNEATFLQRQLTDQFVRMERERSQLPMLNSNFEMSPSPPLLFFSRVSGSDWSGTGSTLLYLVTSAPAGSNIWHDWF